LVAHMERAPLAVEDGVDECVFSHGVCYSERRAKWVSRPRIVGESSQLLTPESTFTATTGHHSERRQCLDNV
jgi:hypothetical protein